ncbi:citrinin biosynthesis oxidoreductase [Colletotrichum truncatum]|uniref:Citrinin biosynthesis oxidoreductase n=1 Tax=Colletotrichum truncatum TaxID=5467 RepID=A0ACC3YDS4_COLTU|nr:citrinin biosynthesis oxidoreductase [Colletotrichum truncatum]XP_036582381.1 citrinin biosynthesis oxidoreductase [Colletotrichum truncatum]KAF6790290.1 citrinin biosynthesis oxidoreductase [Colletotrichum truncatum]KAF6791085.1 citrinin biosynthesis oxidoreductase [Colletotrichum truncatum]
MIGHYDHTQSADTEYLKMNDTATIHLPRILCLHGGGTNAFIFRMQCRVLEKRLKRSFRLVYAQAPFISVEPGPDVTSVYKDCGPFRVWRRDHRMPGVWTSEDVAAGIETALALAMAADDAKGATGEWVGILGFSQGANVAASILYRQQSYGVTSFRFAVLFAGRGPLVWLMPELPQPHGLIDAATPFTHPAPAWITLGSTEHILRLPTIHVHGLKDPGLDRHRDLLRDYCDPLQATLLEWEGGHRMPIKSKDVEVVVQQIMKAAWETECIADGQPWWHSI